MKRLLLAINIMLVACVGAQVKVASLHPLMGDLVRQIGGTHVEVVDIGKPGFDVHSFSPTAKDLQSMAQCQLVVASGKGIERYLGSIKDSLGSVPILEVGRTIPSRKISGDDALYVCCPEHSAGAIDPHWWHDVSNMERAAKVVEKQLIKMDPANKKEYKAQSKVLRARYENLDRWVKSQIATLPKEQRKLVTAHAAFGYFCQAYKMTPVFVLGMSDDHEVPAQELAKEFAKLRQENVRAVFPEKGSNPKVLSELAKQAGAKLGGALSADGASANYELMMQQNVTAIVTGLSS